MFSCIKRGGKAKFDINARNYLDISRGKYNILDDDGGGRSASRIDVSVLYAKRFVEERRRRSRSGSRRKTRRKRKRKRKWKRKRKRRASTDAFANV